MKSLLRTSFVAALALGALAAGPAFAAKDVVFAVASTVHHHRPLRRQRHAVAGNGQVVLRGPVRLRQGHEDDPGASRELHSEQGRPRLHHQAQEGHQVPRRDRFQGRCSEGEPRSGHQSGQQAQALWPVQQQHRQDRSRRRLHRPHYAEDAFLAVHQPACASVDGDDQSDCAQASTAARTLPSIPVGTGPFKFVEWKQTDYLKVAKFDDYWKKGYPKVDSITWKPVIDNNSRAALMQTGEAQFTYPLPYEQAEVLKAKPDLEVVAAPSIMLRYLAMNTLSRSHSTTRRCGRQSRTRSTRTRSPKIAFNGYATPADGVGPRGRRVRGQDRSLALRCGEGEEADGGGRYPNGFETELWSAYNHSIAQKVTKCCNSSCSRSASRPRSPCSRPASAWRKSKAGRTRRRRRCGCIMSAGRHRPARPTGRCARCSESDSWPPKLFNTAYYKSAKFDADLKAALATTTTTEKAKLYKDAQETAYQDAPWVPLVAEEAPVGEEQEADRGLHHSRRVVQFHRHRPALAAGRPAGAWPAAAVG